MSVPQRDIEEAQRHIASAEKRKNVGMAGRPPKRGARAVQINAEVHPDVVLTIAGAQMTYEQVLVKAARCIKDGLKWEDA